MFFFSNWLFAIIAHSAFVPTTRCLVPWGRMLCGLVCAEVAWLRLLTCAALPLHLYYVGPDVVWAGLCGGCVAASHDMCCVASSFVLPSAHKRRWRGCISRCIWRHFLLRMHYIRDAIASFGGIPPWVSRWSHVVSCIPDCHFLCNSLWTISTFEYGTFGSVGLWFIRQDK